MSNRDRAVQVLRAQFGLGTARALVVVDALVAAGLIHVGQGFCTKAANCRLADGHAAGCERT